MKQSDKLTAYYVRAVHKTDILYLDNQMQRLLYHAAPNGYAALTAKGGERKLQRHFLFSRLLFLKC